MYNMIMGVEVFLALWKDNVSPSPGSYHTSFHGVCLLQTLQPKTIEEKRLKKDGRN